MDHSSQVVEQIVRPTGLVDPEVIVKPTRGQIDDLMELINDHDPKALYHQFQAEMPGMFAWDYLEKGPETWRVVITKLKGHADGQCCGSCGGA